jgi:hypothetical protein
MENFSAEIGSFFQLVQSNDVFQIKSIDVDNSNQLIFIRGFHVNNSDEYIDLLKIKEKWYLLDSNQGYDIRFERNISDFLDLKLNSNPDNITPSSNIHKRLIDFIVSHLDKKWNWGGISKNPNITMEDIDSYPDLPWDWQEISKNPNLTMEDIDSYPDLPWDWQEISRNPNLTMEFIDSHPTVTWDWSLVSMNLNITMEDIDSHPDKDLNWSEISNNKFGWKPSSKHQMIRAARS